MTRDEIRKSFMKAVDKEELKEITNQDMFLINHAYGFLRSKPEVKTFNSGMIIPESMVETINKNIKREGKEYNKMYSNNRYYNEIKDILQIAEMSVETSKEYRRERVRIEGYVNHEDLLKTKKQQETTTFPKPIGIIRRGKATIVTWADKTKTTIVLEDGQQDMDIFHTFCIAFTKKMFGNTSAILKTIEENDTDTIERKKKEREEANKNLQKSVMKNCKELSEHLRFEKAVQEKMLEQRAYDEAIRRIIARADKNDATEALRAVANAGVTTEE